MPTAAKLAAALLFAGLVWFASQLVAARFPEGMDAGWFAEVNAAIALVLGWRLAGGLAGTGYVAATGYGLTTIVAITATALFAHCFGEMIRASLKLRYDGPVEAVADVVAGMYEWGSLLVDLPVLGTLVVGGMAAGLLTEAVGRRFR